MSDFSQGVARGSKELMRDAQKTKSRPSRRGRGVKEEICIPIMTPQTPVDQYCWTFNGLFYDFLF